MKPRKPSLWDEIVFGGEVPQPNWMEEGTEHQDDPYMGALLGKLGAGGGGLAGGALGFGAGSAAAGPLAKFLHKIGMKKDDKADELRAVLGALGFGAGAIGGGVIGNRMAQKRYYRVKDDDEKGEK